MADPNEGGTKAHSWTEKVNLVRTHCIHTISEKTRWAVSSARSIWNKREKMGQFISERARGMVSNIQKTTNHLKISFTESFGKTREGLLRVFSRSKPFILQHRKAIYPAVAVVTLAAVFFAVVYKPIYAVSVDGEVIGYVQDVSAVQEEFDEAIHGIEEQMERDVVPSQDVEYIRVTGEKVEVSEAEEVKEKLLECVTLETAGYMIMVEGEELVGVASQEEAEQIIQVLKDDYMDKYAKSDTIIESVEIEEEVAIEEKSVPLCSFMEPDEAISFIMSGGVETKVYKVAEGDSLWTISKKFSLSLEELREANPALKGNLLSIGQELNLQVSKPYVTIVSHERLIEKERIAFNEEVQSDSSMWTWERRVAQRGKSGSKEVVYSVVRRNGIVVEKDIISEEIIEEPVTQIVVRGSRQDTSALIVGTGRFLWPVQGRITSNYGYRSGGFHTGVDIAAPRNTPIRAADDGTVTVAVYSGSGYGNRVEINHGNGYSTLYAHCNSLAVRQGQVVKKGQIIAYVGSTGRSTGDHLHFEIRINGDHVNPMKYF